MGSSHIWIPWFSLQSLCTICIFRISELFWSLVLNTARYCSVAFYFFYLPCINHLRFLTAYATEAAMSTADDACFIEENLLMAKVVAGLMTLDLGFLGIGKLNVAGYLDTRLLEGNWGIGEVPNNSQKTRRHQRYWTIQFLYAYISITNWFAL